MGCLMKENISEKKNQTTGKISIGLQLGGASLETRNLSFGCLRFFCLALLPVLDPLYLSLPLIFTTTSTELGQIRVTLS